MNIFNTCELHSKMLERNIQILLQLRATEVAMSKVYPMLIIFFPLGLHEFTKNRAIPSESGFDYKWVSQLPTGKNRGRGCLEVYHCAQAKVLTQGSEGL